MLADVDKLPRRITTLADGTELEHVKARFARPGSEKQTEWSDFQVARTPSGGTRVQVMSDNRLTQLFDGTYEVWRPFLGTTY